MALSTFLVQRHTREYMYIYILKRQDSIDWTLHLDKPVLWFPCQNIIKFGYGIKEMYDKEGIVFERVFQSLGCFL